MKGLRRLATALEETNDRNPTYPSKNLEENSSTSVGLCRLVKMYLRQRHHLHTHWRCQISKFSARLVMKSHQYHRLLIPFLALFEALRCFSIIYSVHFTYLHCRQTWISCVTILLGEPFKIDSCVQRIRTNVCSKQKPNKQFTFISHNILKKEDD